MRKNHRTKTAFFIIGISLIFVISSAYANYNTMIEADFFARGAKFESGDIADLLFDKQINGNFMPSASFVMGSPEIDIHGIPIMSFLQMGSISSPFSVLRC